MAEDIVFVLSGGVVNTDPGLSFGGPASSTPIGDGINNLFADVTGSEAKDGNTDYRCFYIFNDTADDYVDCKVWISAQVPEGATADVGITTQNEVQSMKFKNAAGGNFSLRVDGHETGLIDYVFDQGQLAANVQAGLRALVNCSQVLVTAFDANFLRVEWPNLEKNKQYPLIELRTNHMTRDDPLVPPSIEIVEIQAGSPINSLAVNTGAVTVAPTGIVFASPTLDGPISIGLLKPSEGFPVWVRRITLPETAALSNDGVGLRMTGDKVVGGGLFA